MLVRGLSFVGTVVLVLLTFGSAGEAQPQRDFKEVVTGADHTCGLLRDGRVACWGGNRAGQLGRSEPFESTLPMIVPGLGRGEQLGRAKQIAADGRYSCALLVDGRVACWGDNQWGQLGDGTFDDSAVPVVVADVGGTGELSGVRQISVGQSHACALLGGGRLVCWGRNWTGQLGDGSTNASPIPVAVLGPDGVGELSGVKQISVAGAHSCAVLRKARAACWGNNASGQLGDGSNTLRLAPRLVVGIEGVGELTGVKQISAGSGHTCAVLSRGRAYCWGYNRTGQLGDGSMTASSRPVAVAGVDGVGQLSKVREISAGVAYTCAVLNDGRARCWGYGRRLQLGDGSTSGSLVPVPVSGIEGGSELSRVRRLDASGWHTCATLTTGRAACWGSNLNGELGYGNYDDGVAPGYVQAAPVDTGELRNARQLTSGHEHSCVLLSTGRVACWGFGAAGALGNGSSSAVAVSVPVMVVGPDGAGELSKVKQVVAGNGWSCALMRTSGVRCWGYNGSGVLGDGTTDNSAIPVVVQAVGGGGELTKAKQLAAGFTHTCAVLTNGRVACWGSNAFGQLGSVSPSSSLAPVMVQAVGGGGELTGVRQVAAGGGHTCALLARGQVACWGNNSWGEVGDGSSGNTRPVPTLVGAVDGINGEGDVLTGAKQIAVGDGSSCALLTGGRVVCWGYNGDGQLGNGTTIDSPLPVVVQNGEDGGALMKVTQIAGGAYHWCAKLTSGEAACWGADFNGEVGGGSASGLAVVPVPVVDDSGSGRLSRVKQVSVGDSFSCGLLTTGRVRCWGGNGFGNLGNGSTIDSLLPVPVRPATG